MKLHITIYASVSGYGWELRDEKRRFVCCTGDRLISRADAIADARRFAELLRVEVEIDG